MAKKETVISLQVVYEDNHIIAVNKPSGYLVQGDETGDIPLTEYVKNYIKIQYDKPGAVFLGVCHRLDRPVSGVVVFARTSKALERMNKLFASQEIKKTYWAIVRERPEPFEGTLTHYLVKDTDRNVTKALDGVSNRNPLAKKSTLTYELIADIDGNYLVEVHPQTGRSHQIRAQLARLGCPIVGDLKYGYKHPNPDASISLHCKSMTFIHPTKLTEITVSSQPPNTYLWKPFLK